MIKRFLTEKIDKLFKEYSAVIITGPRQIGKSTLIKKLLKIENLTKITFDNVSIRTNAQNNPNVFFEAYNTPMFIDEVQKAPEIFNSIKIKIDEIEKPSLYLLTGSQKFKLMKGINESLGGRAAILEMQSLSQAEINGFDNLTIINEYSKMHDRFVKYSKYKDIKIIDRIIRGSMPKIINGDITDIQKYYETYIVTTLFKDINDDILKIYNATKFEKFLKVISNYAGCLINKESIAREVEIKSATVDVWLNVLETIGVIFFLQPYHNNNLSKLIKSPKLYFNDTGVLSYLLNITTNNDFLNYSKSGNLFENFVVSEVNKQFINEGRNEQLYFFRNKNDNNKEIDIIVERGKNIYPIEIKMSEIINQKHFKNYDILKNIKNKTIMPMIVIGNTTLLNKINDNMIAYPVWML
ncbi:MAG: ATP-binding protein [Mycoplasmoidaceae bacterium]|nr:MAG: ATP-binding protein [Mycoplasmoidaceae bacterium]